MIMDLPKFNDETLNIFTDASVTQLGDEYIGCSGAVAYTGTYDRLQKIDELYTINRHSTNNDSEIKAIYLGIQLALKYKGQVKTINLFSDSRICIFGLREWIYNWVQKSGEGPTLISSSNTPVSNQQDILTCIYTIIQYDLQINLYHQKGHVENQNQLNLAIKVFKRSNNIGYRYITHEYMATICSCNSYVDNATRELLLSRTYQYEPEPIQLVRIDYHPFDIDHYMDLVGSEQMALATC